MKVHYTTDMLSDRTVKAISIRVDFVDGLTPEFEHKFINELDSELLTSLEVSICWSVGSNFMEGGFVEFGREIEFKEVDELIKEICLKFKENIKQIVFTKAHFLKHTLTFWTFTKMELIDIGPILGKIFPAIEFTRDYEDTWEWLEGTSPSNELYVNVSRKHNWNKGVHDSELVFSIGTVNNSEEEVDRLGSLIRLELGEATYYGQQKYIKGNERQYVSLKEY
jgi:hypothetical protein